MKTFLTILLAAFGTLTASKSIAQEDLKIPVRLQISGKTGIEGQIRSYFTREFRAIGDLQVTNENEGNSAWVGIDILVMKASDKGGNTSGYIISIAVTDRSPMALLAMAAMDMTTDKEKQNQFIEVLRSFPKEGILVKHALQTLGVHELSETCRALAAEIDGSNLEKLREQNRAWQRLLNSPKK